MRWSRIWTAVALVAALAPAGLDAQGTTGSISGFVIDETGAALPGATVTIRDADTDRKRVLIADAAGRYRAPQLAPGQYEVIVELQGFRSARVADVPLTIGQDAVVNVRLKVGGIDEQVIVTAEARTRTRNATRHARINETSARRDTISLFP